MLLALVAGLLVVALGFQAGGFFPDAVAGAAIVLALLLVGRVTFADHPFSGVTAPFVAGLALLMGLAAWTLLSSAWSESPGRALIEYDRVLLYVLAFALFGAVGCTPRRLRWLARGLAGGIFAVAACALLTRVAPDVWAVQPTLSAQRLSFPLTYWNALGLLAALGLVLCLAMTGDEREAPAVRVLSAAALPVLAATLVLTFSRGAMAAGLIGLLAVVLVGRRSGLVSGLLVALPAIAVPAVAAYGAELLAGERPATDAAAAQGHDLALVVVICVAVAAAARLFLLRLDVRLARAAAPELLRRRGAAAGIAAAGLAVGIAAALALGAPAALRGQYERFVAGDAIAKGGARLTDPGNNGRLDQWDVGLDGFREQPLHGQGAGTYALQWQQRRPQIFQVEDAHSLYVEVLAELGLVGLLLVGGALALVLAGLLVRARGPDAMAGAGLFAAALTWAVHAGIDWDWEVPAVTLWVFAAGGMALSGAPRPWRPLAQPARIAIALGCLFLALMPLRVLQSERALDASREAFAAGGCPTAIDRALDSIEAVGSRAEPYVILGFCNVRMGHLGLAVKALDNAVARDPSNWEPRYGLALVRGAAGLDPRPAARQAARLNPGEALAIEAVRRFDTGEPARWRAEARDAPLPIE